MKNRIIALFIAAVLSAGLIAGCSSSVSDVKNEPEEKQEEVQTEPEEESPEESAEKVEEESSAGEAKAEDEEEPAEGLVISTAKEFISRTDDDGKVIAYGHYPVIKASGKDYEKLSKALDDFTDSLKADVEKNLDDIADFAKEDIKDGRDLPGGYYTYNCDALITRADEEVVSILLTYDTFSGGAHPSSWFVSGVYDSKGGEELNIGNVVKDMDSLPKTLSDKLLSEYDKEMFFDEDVEGLIKEAYGDDDKYVFTLDNGGICFYFSAYQLAPYASGSQIVTFDYDDEADFVLDVYKENVDNMIEGIIPEKKYRFSDSDKASFSWYANYEDDYEYELDVEINGKQVSETITCAGMQPYLVKKDGKYFIYVNELQMNDYQSIDIYKIQAGVFKKVGSFERGFRDTSPTDPDNFYLAGRTDLLSTNNTYRSYHVGDDGMPVANEEYDHVVGSVSEKLTLKKDIEAEVYADEDASEPEKTTLEKGTVLYYFRTDNETFMDMKTEDGRIVRFYPKTGEWPQTIDGTDIEELFDGVMFAG
ncbi:MAG: DUF3298 and DUF4163 domain-containing protein [Lachnospiraceae bacterium]|nr:DUF3298 and DUF4163 domain-containing protein [Lachnospiraceae bacterium]